MRISEFCDSREFRETRGWSQTYRDSREFCETHNDNHNDNHKGETKKNKLL